MLRYCGEISRKCRKKVKVVWVYNEKRGINIYVYTIDGDGCDGEKKTEAETASLARLYM